MITATKTQSFVVELMQLAANGDCRADAAVNFEAFTKASELMSSVEISDFERVTPFLKENGCDASVVFNTAVTQETDDAFAAYLCYCV